MKPRLEEKWEKCPRYVWKYLQSYSMAIAIGFDEKPWKWRDEKIIQKRQVLNWNSNKSISYLVWFQGLVDTESSIKVHGSVLTPGRKNKFEWKLGKVDCAIKKLHTSMSKTRQDSDSWGQLIIYCQQNTENSINFGPRKCEKTRQIEADLPRNSVHANASIPDNFNGMLTVLLL